MVVILVSTAKMPTATKCQRSATGSCTQNKLARRIVYATFCSIIPILLMLPRVDPSY
ncbi:hypothetical protein BDV59DRAFT_167632 [Aspergillus ambiguus]|uniref:uncharacterized protein n=1 Tax=Aspergillus ambiguus TaxID=176160 RepID=UPI003CCCAD40